MVFQTLALSTAIDAPVPTSRYPASSRHRFLGFLWVLRVVFRRLPRIVDAITYDRFGHLDHPPAGIVRALTQPLECLVGADVKTRGQHARGLLDRHPVCQCRVQLLGKQVLVAREPLLQDGDGGHVGQSLSDWNVGVTDRCVACPCSNACASKSPPAKTNPTRHGRHTATHPTPPCRPDASEPYAAGESRHCGLRSCRDRNVVA